MASQTENILAHLKNGKSITSLKSIDLFGCLRLSARIGNLRDLGHNIHMERVKTPSGKRVGRYTLIPPAKPRIA